MGEKASRGWRRVAVAALPAAVVFGAPAYAAASVPTAAIVMDGGHSGGTSGTDYSHLFPGEAPDAGTAGGGHGSHDRSEPPPDRPRALVLGGFGALNVAVLTAAGVLRHRGAADRRRRSRAARSAAASPTSVQDR